MRKRTARRFSRTRQRRGAIAVLAAVLVVVLLITSAISINIAYMQYARAELRAANDAATRAAGEALARTGKDKEAREAAKKAGLQNTVAGVPFVVEDDDIVFGYTIEDASGNWVFTADAEPYNSVRVNAGRTADSKSGEIGLFVGGILGNASFAPESEAAVVNTLAPRDFALVVDRSGSMSRPAGGGQSKWEALLSAADAFFKALEQTKNDKEQVGLASYSSASTLDQWLKEKYKDTNKVLEGLSIGGWTNIHSGIADGSAILNGSDYREGASKIMVLLTDGKHNTGPDPMLAANAAAASGIEIYTITFGNGSHVDIPQMQAIAAATGGLHYHAPDGATLEQVFLQVIQDSAGIHFIQ